MNIKYILEKIDSFKSNIINIYTKIQNKIPNILEILKIISYTIAGLFIFLILSSSNISNQNIISTILVLATIFLLFNKFIEAFNLYISYLKEENNLNNFDLNLTGSNTKITIDGNIIPKSISQALDDHIEDILNSNILFFMNIKDTEYIRANTEQEILNSLIDNVMKFTSPIFKKKLSLYYGEENIDILIGRRCLIIVSLYIANHNKNIYVSTPNMN